MGGDGERPLRETNPDDAAADLLRELPALRDSDREAVRREAMTPRAFHAKWAGRPCGAGWATCGRRPVMTNTGPS
jgi:hypothetical protein